jgi:hypothetical protein
MKRANDLSKRWNSAVLDLLTEAYVSETPTKKRGQDI